MNVAVSSQGPAAAGNPTPQKHAPAAGALGDDEYEAAETKLIRGVPRWRLDELAAKHAIEDEYAMDEPEDEEPEDDE